MDYRKAHSASSHEDMAGNPTRRRRKKVDIQEKLLRPNKQSFIAFFRRFVDKEKKRASVSF